MEKKINSAKLLKQKKFLLVLPLLMLPFITLMFWALGGGKASAVGAQSNMQQGLNLKLPDAKLKDDKTLNKLSFYQQATLDSFKTKEAEKLDPYWSKSLNDSGLTNAYSSGLSNDGIDVNQMKVYNKLDELKKALSKSKDASDLNSQSNYNPYSLKSYSSSNDVDRLQSMMQKMNENKTEDPEISQLNNMLDKIKTIQEPERIVGNDSAKAQTFQVKLKSNQADVSLLKSSLKQKTKTDTDINYYVDNAFYSNGFFNLDSTTDDNTIEAIIPETQSIVTGATIKLALCNDVTIQHVVMPAGTFIYGTASINNERLKIAITSIRFQNAILPVALTVFDMDGQEGINVPGSISRTVSKESANNAISGMNVTTLDPSVGAQAASAGIEAAKTLFGKKIKLVRITIRSGYKVLLEDTHVNNF